MIDFFALSGITSPDGGSVKTVKAERFLHFEINLQSSTKLAEFSGSMKARLSMVLFAIAVPSDNSNEQEKSSRRTRSNQSSLPSRHVFPRAHNSQVEDTLV